MAKLFDLRENIRSIYQKYGMYIRPLMKGLLSFIILYVLSIIFGYDPRFNNIFIFVVLSVMQAFLPVSFVFYVGTALVALNLWSVSPEIMFIFLAVAAASWLAFIRVDQTCALLVILTPVLFFLKLEYFIPVLAGMIFGLGGILPVMGGILIYYIGVYTRDVSALLVATTGNDTGIALSRMIQLFTINKTLMVVLVAFCLVIFISAILYRMFHEKAWLFTVIIGNIALAFILLSGRLIFDLDYTIWRVLLECFLAAGVATIYQLFRGIGDAGRMEKVQFEDDEYIYYVKAVPKIRVAITERNVTRIKSKEEDGSEEETGKKDSKNDSKKDSKKESKKDSGDNKKSSGNKHDKGSKKKSSNEDKAGAAKAGEVAAAAATGAAVAAAGTGAVDGAESVAAAEDITAKEAIAAKERLEQEAVSVEEAVANAEDSVAEEAEAVVGDRAADEPVTAEDSVVEETVAVEDVDVVDENDSAKAAGVMDENIFVDENNYREDTVTVEEAFTVEKTIITDETEPAEKPKRVRRPFADEEDFAAKEAMAAEERLEKEAVSVEETVADAGPDAFARGVGADDDGLDDDEIFIEDDIL